MNEKWVHECVEDETVKKKKFSALWFLLLRILIKIYFDLLSWKLFSLKSIILEKIHEEISLIKMAWQLCWKNSLAWIFPSRITAEFRKAQASNFTQPLKRDKIKPWRTPVKRYFFLMEQQHERCTQPHYEGYAFTNTFQWISLDFKLFLVF